MDRLDVEHGRPEFPHERIHDEKRRIPAGTIAKRAKEDVDPTEAIERVGNSGDSRVRLGRPPEAIGRQHHRGQKEIGEQPSPALRDRQPETPSISLRYLDAKAIFKMVKVQAHFVLRQIRSSSQI